MKINDPMPGDVREGLKRDIQSHREVLRELLKDAAANGQQFLIFANGGAAVALMAFMGANAHLRQAEAAWLSLDCFVLGVVLAGILAALMYLNSAFDFKYWLRDSTEFFNNNLHLAELYNNLNSRSDK